ncbi:MAG: SLC13 family permease, partial [Candidatus Aminicenantes bacterium]
MEPRKKIGFILGPLFFLSAYLSPLLSDNPRAHKLLAVFLLVVVWWVTECIPIPITALLIPIFITTLGISSVKEAFAPFANPIIMLFLGSFVLARAMCVHTLDKKLAFTVLSMKSIAHKKTRILFALGLTSLFLSMWISNTATTAMMYPIALGVLDAIHSGGKDKKNLSFGIILLLTLAYAASIGGVGTPIGSPPNLIAIGMLERLADYRITFFQWMIVGFTVLLPMYLFLFFYMRSRIKDAPESEGPVDLSSLKSKGQRGKLSRAQKNVLFAFSVTVFLWVFPGIVSLIGGRNAPLFL